MVWTKVDDGMWRNPKIRGMSNGEFRLFVCALNWSVDQRTDGNILDADLVAIIPGSEARTLRKYADGLVTHGVWARSVTGWTVVSYALYQPTKEQIEQQRDQGAQRQKAWRDRHKKDTVTHNADNTVTHNDPVTSHDPDPTRPDPSTTTLEEVDISNTAAATDAAADSAEWAANQWGIICGVAPAPGVLKNWVRKVTEFMEHTGQMPSVKFMETARGKGINSPAGWLHVWEPPSVAGQTVPVQVGVCSHRWAPIDNDEPSMDQCVKCHLYRGGGGVDLLAVCACLACTDRQLAAIEAGMERSET